MRQKPLQTYKETIIRIFYGISCIIIGGLTIPHFHNTLGLWCLIVFWSYSLYSFLYQMDIVPKITELEIENAELRSKIILLTQAYNTVTSELSTINNAFAVVKSVSTLGNGELNTLKGKIKEVSKQGEDSKVNQNYQQNKKK